MVKRVLAGLLAAAAIGTLGAQAAMAAAPGNGDAGGPGAGRLRVDLDERAAGVPKLE